MQGAEGTIHTDFEQSIDSENNRRSIRSVGYLSFRQSHLKVVFGLIYDTSSLHLEAAMSAFL